MLLGSYYFSLLEDRFDLKKSSEMAGMLPGVETARRRRFYGSSGWSDSPGISASTFGSSRRSSFCHSSTTPSLQRSMVSQSCHDERLGGAAREAKERLDERLRAPWKSEPKRLRRGVAPSVSVEERRKLVVGDLQTEVFGLKKSGSKRFNWAKMSWKASDQNECAVCLDHFKVGETLAHLPCAHRFHSRCLVPWLENNAHCPCCRMILAPN